MTEPSANEPIWGLVLAGGESRRMGTDKALLKQNGETQLARMVALLERHLPRVFVSARESQTDDGERSRFPRIVDRYEGLGPLAGILSAMDEHPTVGWLVVACDLPNVDDATISDLLEQRDAEAPFTAYRSSHDGLPEPLCAIFSAATRQRLAEFVEEGVRCPRKIMIRSATQLLAQANPRALDNVNTPEDLAASSLDGARRSH